MMGLILGRFHMDHLPQVIDVALEGCRNIYTILDKVCVVKFWNLSLASFFPIKNKFCSILIIGNEFPRLFL
jgi:hypothetical protein